MTLAAVSCLLMACAPAGDVSGTWSLRLSLYGACHGEMTLIGDGETYAGTYALCQDAGLVVAKLNGNELHLTLTRVADGSTSTARLSLAGRTLDGWVHDPDVGEHALQGWRGKPPEGRAGKKRRRWQGTASNGGRHGSR